jgi:hypothetical protein
MARNIATVCAICMAGILSTSHAQVAMTPEQLDMEYTRIKAAVALRYDELLKGEAKEKANAPDDFFDTLPPSVVDTNLVAVFDCGFTPGLDFASAGSVEGAYAGSPAWAAVLFHVAKAATVVQITAKQFGYPEEVWVNELASYERKGVASAKELARRTVRSAGEVESLLPAYPDRIVESMEAYRIKTKKRSPELVAQEGCGAGESVVQIVTEPSARLVRVIPEFFAMVCEKAGKLLSGDTCPYWREAPQRAHFSVSGLYRYNASWPDGAERTGKVDFDKLGGGDDTPVFRIKK